MQSSPDPTDTKLILTGHPVPARWLYCGIALICLFLALAAISRGFGYTVPLLDRPLITLVSLLTASGIVYLFIAWSRNALRETGHVTLWWIVVVGLVMRAAMFFSVPMMEDDFYRYLWDGAVTAAGLDPYERAPEAVRYAPAPGTPSDSTFAALALDGETVIKRVNHPHLKTIYPPLAQLAFAAGNLLASWSIYGWRLVVLLFDLATLALLVTLLSHLGLQPAMLALWWWNPLLVKEIYNSAHMDILLVPLLLGALLLAARGKLVAGSVFLGLAAGVKLWPVVLLPLLVRSRWTSWKKNTAALLAFAGVCSAVYYPLAGKLTADSSGFAAYFSSWEMNDGLFMLPLWVYRGLSGGAPWAQTAARLTVGVILVGVIAWLCRRPWDDGGQLVRRALVVVAVMFMLSPTQFPWYFTWLLPLLALAPVRGLLLLTALLPLYYLRFHLDTRGLTGLFDNWLVWLEYLPAIALLAWDWHAGQEAR